MTGTAKHGHVSDAGALSPCTAAPLSLPHPSCPGTPALLICKVSLGNLELEGISESLPNLSTQIRRPTGGGQGAPEHTAPVPCCYPPCSDRAGGPLPPQDTHPGLAHTSPYVTACAPVVVSGQIERFPGTLPWATAGGALSGADSLAVDHLQSSIGTQESPASLPTCTLSPNINCPWAGPAAMSSQGARCTVGRPPPSRSSERTPPGVLTNKPKQGVPARSPDRARRQGAMGSGLQPDTASSSVHHAVTYSRNVDSSEPQSPQLSNVVTTTCCGTQV